jgi:hypothetical protein
MKDRYLSLAYTATTVGIALMSLFSFARAF